MRGCSVIGGLGLLAPVIVLCSGQSATRPATQPASAGPKAYVEGIRIDWQKQIVELDATICLRQGALELFACSPHTKEHESIVVIHARPLHIFEALGLIGLTPGAPPSYDPATDRSTPARGDKVRIEVATSDAGQERVFGIHEWMRSSKDGQPMAPRDWVFAGSRKLENGHFAADSEGTLICVVDFDTALIALPESHTSDDAELWLEANTERIPPRGTKCVVRISPAQPRRATTLPATAPAAEATPGGMPRTPKP
jgi:hypothetical protein